MIEGAGLARLPQEAGRWPPGLYVHVPYCASICPYCDFNVYRPEGGRAELSALVEAVLDEAEAWGWLGAGLEGHFDTVFIGGGTPTMLSADLLARLLHGMRSRLPVGQATEWSVEANPGTLTAEKVEVLAGAGVNRVSLGVQSFQPQELKRLGRGHSLAQVARSLRLLRAAGLVNVNVDLMFGVPGQSVASWKASLQATVDLGVPHVSAYCLTLEEGTPFYERWKRGELEVAPEPLQARMYRTAVRVLGQAGLRRYEVSNFAVPGRECRHNLNYWRAGEYLGIGPGAHSHWGGRRFSNIRHPGRYRAAALAFKQAVSAGAGPSVGIRCPGSWSGPPTVEFCENLSEAQRMDETVLLHLRLAEGLDCVHFLRRFGRRPEEVYPPSAWAHLVARGLIRTEGGRWRLTGRGFLVADAVTARILSARPDAKAAATGVSPG